MPACRTHSIAGAFTWINPAAFAAPAPGNLWNTAAQTFFMALVSVDVDFSVVKNTKITERINTQFRIELFNIFNRKNSCAAQRRMRCEQFQLHRAEQTSRAWQAAAWA